jgi:hypothetical protein
MVGSDVVERDVVARDRLMHPPLVRREVLRFKPLGNRRRTGPAGRIHLIATKVDQVLREDPLSSGFPGTLAQQTCTGAAWGGGSDGSVGGSGSCKCAAVAGSWWTRFTAHSDPPKWSN